MTNEITIPDVEYLPPELLLDEHHPANAKYMQSLDSIRRLIVSQTRKMTMWHVEAVKMRVNGSNNTEIAERYGKAVGTVSATLGRHDAKELRATLQHYNVSMDGPNDAHRRRMLWEIAVDNQHMEPKVSISSIVEINKMNGTYNAADKDTAINITINNNLLPKGKLDT